jgi:MFS transporter, DHA2 family, multidrug resistance protein
MIGLGLAIFSFSLWQMAGWSLEMDWRPVAISGFIQGLGMGLVFMPLNAMAFATLSPQYRTDGSSLLNLFRSIGASAGISLVTMFLARNAQVSHADISQHVTATTIPSLDLNAADRLGSFADAAFAAANAEVTRQAMMIAYIDDFYLMAIVCLAVLPLVLVLKRPAKIEIIHAE